MRFFLFALILTLGITSLNQTLGADAKKIYNANMEAHSASLKVTNLMRLAGDCYGCINEVTKLSEELSKLQMLNMERIERGSSDGGKVNLAKSRQYSYDIAIQHRNELLALYKKYENAEKTGSLCGKCGSQTSSADPRLAALASDFKSDAKAQEILNTFDEAITCLSNAQQAFERRKTDVNFRKRFDKFFEKYLGDANDRNITVISSRIAFMEKNLKIKAKEPAKYVQNPIGHPQKMIRNNVKSGITAFAAHFENKAGGVIFLNPKFFNDQKVDKKTILIHEESHLLFNTDDKGVFTEGILFSWEWTVPFVPEKKAMNDANSLEIFLRNICGMQ